MEHLALVHGGHMTTTPSPAARQAASAMLLWASVALIVLGIAYGMVDDDTLRAPVDLRALGQRPWTWGDRLVVIGIGVLLAVPLLRNVFLARLPSGPLRGWAWASSAVWLFVVGWRAWSVLTSGG